VKALVTPLGIAYVFVGVGAGFITLLLVLNALFPALVGVLAVNGVAKGEEGAFGAMLLMFGTTLGVGLVAVVSGALSVAYIIDGIGLVARQGWARWLGIGLAVPVMFMCMPMGMMIGMLALITLLMPDTAEEFAPTPD
jgi:hypothetical protein